MPKGIPTHNDRFFRHCYKYSQWNVLCMYIYITIILLSILHTLPQVVSVKTISSSHHHPAQYRFDLGICGAERAEDSTGEKFRNYNLHSAHLCPE